MVINILQNLKNFLKFDCFSVDCFSKGFPPLGNGTLLYYVRNVSKNLVYACCLPSIQYYNLLNQISKTDISAGLTPEIRDA